MRMDPENIGGLNFPFVHVHGDETNAGHLVLRRAVPKFCASYNTQAPPLGYEHRRCSRISFG
jgi:hypothetical protein